MLRFILFLAFLVLALSVAWLTVQAPGKIWLTALAAAPVMALVMALALLPIIAMALESAYVGTQPHVVEEAMDESALRARIAKRGHHHSPYD